MDKYIFPAFFEPGEKKDMWSLFRIYRAELLKEITQKRHYIWQKKR